MFSVNSMYTKLEGLMVWEGNRSMEEKRIFGQIWQSPAPSKVVAFAWTLLLDRIPTRMKLAWRNVLSPESHL